MEGQWVGKRAWGARGGMGCRAAPSAPAASAPRSRLCRQRFPFPSLHLPPPHAAAVSHADALAPTRPRALLPPFPPGPCIPPLSVMRSICMLMMPPSTCNKEGTQRPVGGAERGATHTWGRRRQAHANARWCKDCWHHRWCTPVLTSPRLAKLAGSNHMCAETAVLNHNNPHSPAACHRRWHPPQTHRN